MMDRYTAAPLDHPGVEQAYPVVQMMIPGVDRRWWREFALKAIGANQRAGIMGVRTVDGYIVGLFRYRLDDDLRHGNVLLIDTFMVMDMLDPCAAAGAMMKAMDDLALRLACSAIHVAIPDYATNLTTAHGPLMRSFVDSGHLAEATWFCRRINHHH